MAKNMKRNLDMPERKTVMNNLMVWERPSETNRFNTFANHPGVDSCLDFMAKNFCHPIQIKDLVKISGMSLRGVNKAFHKNIGMMPGAILRHLRIEYAKRLLVEKDLRLKQVAKQCGYRSENTFCVAFQRATKTSPKKFQTQYLLAARRRHLRSRGHPIMGSRLIPLAPGEDMPMRFDTSKHPARRMI
jgi:AraC-like DNA-binding protein